MMCTTGSIDRSQIGHKGRESRDSSADESRDSRPLCPIWERSILPVVHIIARSTLRRFIESMSGNRNQRAVGASLDAWFHEVERAEWDSSADVKKSYSNA